MSSKSSRERLPFEPRQNKKKISKKAPAAPDKNNSNQPRNSAYDGNNASVSAIPDHVSTRMVRRMAVFSGIPTGMGIFSFFIFYLIVTQEWLKVPNSAVVLVSMALFGLGVLGLSYGLLSTSWDEGRIGSWWGWQEFKLNLGRMTSAWKSARQEALEKKAINDD
jgi:hypothetical protein